MSRPTPRGPLLTAWLLAGAVELALAAGTVDPPLAWQVGAELAVVAGVGAVHAAWAPPGWRGSLAWPGAALLAAVLLRIGSLPLAWELGRWAFVAVVLVMGVRVVDDLSRRLPAWPAAIGLVLLAGLVARFTRLLTAPVAQPHHRLAEELLRPLRPAPAPTADGPPVVVISIDTLRVDRAATMESHRRLAARGASWERALSSSSWTVPALASLWTGLPPAEHGAGNLPGGGGFSSLDPDAPHLAEQLAAQGYATAAFVANPFVASELGLRRGFQEWANADERPGHPLVFLGHRAGPRARDGQRVVDRALAWLDGAPDQGFLLWVHLFDPHLPYTHATDPLAAALQAPTGVRDGSVPVTPALKAAVNRAYDDEVAYADAQVGRLLDALQARGLLDSALVILTSDHGEELWDHGGFEHGHSHHAEVIDVPLVLVAPGLAPGPRPGVASLTDLAPTVRATLGLSPGGLDLRSGVPPERIATAAGNLYGDVQQSARSPRRKVILTLSDAGEQRLVYDAAADPEERQPLLPDTAAAAPEEAAARAALPAAGDTAAAVNEAALRALGYVE